MALNCTVGGAHGMFERQIADRVAESLDQTFGEGDWEATASQGFGEMAGASWAEFQDLAANEMGAEEIPNILALGALGRAVYLPGHVRAMTLASPVGPLRCASLPGLRGELTDLGERWGISLDDAVLDGILRDESEGGVADAPEIVAFARLALAANEAMRRDCPLWLVGE